MAGVLPSQITPPTFSPCSFHPQYSSTVAIIANKVCFPFLETVVQ